MDSQTEKYHKSIFQFELAKLKEKGYITDEHYAITMNAHNKYYSDLDEKRQEHELIHAAVIKQNTRQPAQQPVKPKKKLSPEEARERNISWLLNIGVILLLIGGLFVATSNWDTMSNWMKSGSIAFVSLLFYGMAYISNKILKIERTSFAFIVLGSLFLPIFILSVGWFKLLGPYFSFYGEGRFILGAAGSFLIVPIYSILAQKLSSRLFVWFAYIALSASAGYTLAAFKLEKDGFYLGLMLFNALLAAAYHRIKNHEDLKLFSKELVYFAQINLVLSTILMLAFFNSPVFYSVNILVSAAIYLSMVYVTGKKEFHFVFSLLIVYGAYQLIEHSVLDVAAPVFYALVGTGFLLVPRMMDHHYPWEKVFRVTSSIVSILAFLYISVEGILLRMNEPSAVLLLAYIIIAVQFIYLAKMMANVLFAYLAPIFIASALYEIMLMLDQAFGFKNFILPVFFIGFVLFISIGYSLKHPMLKVIDSSSRDVGNGIMVFSILLAIGLWDGMAAGTMLLIFSFVMFLINTVEKRSFYTEAAPWAIPVSIGFAFMFYGEEMRRTFSLYHDSLGMAMNTVMASAVLLVLTYVLKWKNHKTAARNAFFIAQGFYSISLFSALVLPINDVWVRPAILLGGVAMYLALYFAIKQVWVPFFAAAVSLLAYFSIINGLTLAGVNFEYFNWIQLPIGAFILLAIAYFLLKKDSILAKGFSWIGHFYMPLAMFLTLFMYRENSIWGFLGALGVYWISSRVSRKEWKVRVFLYSGFLALFMAILTGMDHIRDGEYSEFAFLLVSCIIFAFWLHAHQADKQRSIFFLIPWSVVGILAFLSAYPFGWVPFVVSVLYAAGLIAYLHRLKLDILSGIPLFLIFIGTMKFLYINQISPEFKTLTAAGFGLILAIIGKTIYNRTFLFEGKRKQADSYTITAFLFFLSIYLFHAEDLWAKVLPGLLISIFIYLQRNRIPSNHFWMPGLLSGFVLLEPYYALLRHIEIPALLTRELYVLPWIALIILTRKILKDRYGKLTNRLQWALLISVSLLLVQDGLASNTVYDALIVGTLSLLSMLAGTFFRIKAYFFVGSGVLLLNVLLQTRPYWGSLPWWAYLLIAGSLLITVASYNEWQKQQTAKGEEPLISIWKNIIIKKLKEWQ
ncbi:SCO7613 C-terminal domain-containing membrane protein [Cytobacillus oceanisediminis]|uniref:SCO7613 C-terminal domain-containing membrane protein n=1 Tax=Cytobacillus oceanisediminis TaxID=665099 RepID=UPI003736A6FB